MVLGYILLVEFYIYFFEFIGNLEIYIDKRIYVLVGILYVLYGFRLFFW